MLPKHLIASVRRWQAFAYRCTDETLPERSTNPDLHIGPTALLEITLCCTGPICRYCYRKKLGHNDVGVAVDGSHVAAELLFRRIDWIIEHTSATTVILLGGEPLLHPDLEQIITYVLKQGLWVQIITAGDVNTAEGKRNLDLIAALYAAGLIGIELSLHPGPKEQAYVDLHKLLQTCMPYRVAALKLRAHTIKTSSRHTHLRELVRLALMNGSINGNLTIDARFLRDLQPMRDALQTVLTRTAGKSEHDTCTTRDVPGGLDQRSLARYYWTHFRNNVTLEQPLSRSQRLSWPARIPQSARDAIGRNSLRLVSATDVAASPYQDSHGQLTRAVSVPMGSKVNPVVCPAMEAVYDTKSGQLLIKDVIVVRTDGELTYATPSCVVVRNGLCNVDHHQNRTDIVHFARQYVDRVKMVIYSAKRALAEQFQGATPCYVDPEFMLKRGDARDGPTCYSCPLSSACNVCQWYARDD